MKTPWWFLHKTPLAFILVPVSWIYYLFSKIVFVFRKIGAYKSRRKIICVGNIMAGGVGKTPIVHEDEAAMLARDGLRVHVGDRKSNVILLNRQSDDDTPIVMDDGYQNPRIKKDISVLVFDQALGYGNGFLLPAGPLREPRRAVRRADAIIVIKSDHPRKRFVLPGGIPVFYATNKTISPYDEDEKLFVFAGIGYPKKFFRSLDNVVGHRAFADHYQYTDEDLKKLQNAAQKRGAKLITTEKDWMRLPPELRDEIKYARLDTVIDDDFWKWLGEKVKCQH